MLRSSAPGVAKPDKVRSPDGKARDDEYDERGPRGVVFGAPAGRFRSSEIMKNGGWRPCRGPSSGAEKGCKMLLRQCKSRT